MDGLPVVKGVVWDKERSERALAAVRIAFGLGEKASSGSSDSTQALGGVALQGDGQTLV